MRTLSEFILALFIVIAFLVLLPAVAGVFDAPDVGPRPGSLEVVR